MIVITTTKGSNWSHQNSDKRFKEKSASHTRKHSTDSLQNAAVLGTARVIQKVLQHGT
jgi:hypothetical protein